MEYIQKANERNLSKLSKLIDKYLIPQELEKKKNAEVSTPHALRQEMLDKIPIEFWTTPKKVFEPCSGKGGFVIDIVDRFNTGLSNLITDEKERYRIIVEECLYFSDINPTNIYICSLLLDPHTEYKLNFNEGNTLELDISAKWGITGFDAVIGNPPYTTDENNTNRKGEIPIYDKFVLRFVDKTKYLLYIIPSRYFSGGKGLNTFREFMMNCRKIKLLNHFDEDVKIFKDVDIKGGVNYFLYDNDYNGDVLFNNEPINLSKYDIILKPRFYKIIEKIYSRNLKSITDILGYRPKIKTNDKRLCNDGKIKCYVSSLKSKNNVKYISSFTDDKFENSTRLLVLETTKDTLSGFSKKMIINSDNSLFTTSFIPFLVAANEAENLKHYLSLDLVNFILISRKASHLITKNSLKWIPLLSFAQRWTNAGLYEYFNFTEDEIRIIELVIA
jgi:hypothetical protein